MAWALSGSTITQTGTNSDLSGLAAIAGVTNVLLPTVRGLAVYDIGGLTLSVQGTLAINPEVEMILCENNKCLTITNGGVLNVNGITARDGTLTYSEQYWLKGSAISNTAAGGFDSAFAVIHVTGTGTLNWSGGYVAKAGAMVFDANSVVRIKNAGWNTHAFFSTFPAQVRQFTANIEVDGFKFIDGGSWTDMVKPLTNNFSGFSFNHAYGFGKSAAQFDGDWHTFRDYSAFNEKAASGFWSDVWDRFVNAEKGSDLIVVGFSATDSTSNVGVWESRKEVKVRLSADTYSTSGAKVWVVDSDDGFRTNWTNALTPINYVADRLYTQTSAATTGNSSETGLFDILLASAVRQSGGTAGVNDSGLNKKSYRGKNGDTSDVFEFRIASYWHQLKQTDVVLKGNGVLNLTDKVFPDQSITQPDKTVVAAYTEIDTSAKLYDRAKLWLVDNFVGQTETILTRSGTTIDLRALNLVIDPNAVATSAFNGVTITIKAGTFTGSLTTTGVITLQNGAVVTGGYVDANGDSFLSFSGIDVWTVYSDSNRTNQLGAGTSASIFRFNYVPSTTYYLTVISAGTTFLIETVPTEAGETEVTLATAALLVALTSKVDALENAPSASTVAAAVWNEVLTGATHSVPTSAGRRLRTLADTVVLSEGVGNSMSNGDGVGYITLPAATTVCVKQAIRVGDMVRYVRAFDPATKIATLDSPWCTITAGDVEYTIFSGRESALGSGATLSEIEASTVLAKEATVRAVKSGTGLIPYLLVK